MIQPHIHCREGDIAKYVLLPGDPARVEKIIKHLKKPKKVAYNREFLTYIGKYKGVEVSVTSTGIGCPSAAIAVEELTNLGGKYFIRVGTCGSLKEGINVGDIIIPYAATRSEGTTQEYLPIDFPAVADYEIFSALKWTAEGLKLRYFTGVNRTHDGFYENTANILRWANIFNDKRFKTEDLPLISSEMECSAVFVTAMVRGAKAGALMTVNTVEPLSKLADDPDALYTLDESLVTNRGVDNEIKVALEAIVRLERHRREER